MMNFRNINFSLRVIRNILRIIVLVLVILYFLGIDLKDVFAANLALYDYELNSQIDSFNFYDCDKTDCSAYTNKSFTAVSTVNREGISYYTNTSSFTFGQNYGAIFSLRSNLNFVQGQVYSISILYANDKGYLGEPETSWISYDGSAEKFENTVLNYQSGQLGTCSMGGNTFKYCGRLYLTFVARSNGMWFHFRVKPISTASYSNLEFFVNSEVGIYTLGTYDERTNIEIYNKMDINLRQINSSIKSLETKITGSQQSIINNQNSNVNEIKENQDKNTQQTIENDNKNHEDMKNTITDDSNINVDTNELGNLTGLLPAGPVDSLLNIPFYYTGKIVNSFGGSCKPIEVPVLGGKKWIFTCLGNQMYSKIFDSYMMKFIELIPCAFILIAWFKNLYKRVDRATGMQTNSDDEWGVI